MISGLAAQLGRIPRVDASRHATHRGHDDAAARSAPNPPHCRHCHRLTYASTRETDDDRASRRANKIRRRLGWEPGILNAENGKPKGMHWDTYWRLVARHHETATESMRLAASAGENIICAPHSLVAYTFSHSSSDGALLCVLYRMLVINRSALVPSQYSARTSAAAMTPVTAPPMTSLA